MGREDLRNVEATCDFAHAEQIIYSIHASKNQDYHQLCARNNKVTVKRFDWNRQSAKIARFGFQTRFFGHSVDRRGTVFYFLFC
jgi:hypothetical protein